MADAVVAVDGDDVNDGAAAVAATVDHVQEPSWDESGHSGPAAEDRPDRVEC